MSWASTERRGSVNYHRLSADLEILNLLRSGRDSSGQHPVQNRARVLVGLTKSSQYPVECVGEVGGLLQLDTVGRVDLLHSWVCGELGSQSDSLGPTCPPCQVRGRGGQKVAWKFSGQRGYVRETYLHHPAS